MEFVKLIIVILLCFVMMMIFSILSVKMLSKYLILQHNVNITVDDKNKVKEITEHFTMVNGMPLPATNDVNLKVTERCANKSLNEAHKTGEIEKKPWNTLCETKTQEEEGGEKYFKTYKPPKMYMDEPGVLGSNYMMYNGNPNPYHLDFTLYDKDAPNNVPVGVNFVSS